MKERAYSIAAFVIAFMFWMFDASIHYFVYGEQKFEFIPDDANELWMRAVIFLLIVLFGMYADFTTRKLLIKEKQLEAGRIYNSMLHASYHILNNLLNQMQLFKLEALKSNDFDREILKLYDDSIDEAVNLIHRLSEVEIITDENIWASVEPRAKVNLPNKTDSSEANKSFDK